ncbi:cytochrome b/b6 domain-containing protein [Corynebacterium sp. AOP40-9SA-29]|uniref:cytochrome b/b6 domain-containing protein n=1 Tax=Corynebacterium sp. AOP40-9SA-29 TaxID=3457677 RepID=UPI0040340C24
MIGEKSLGQWGKLAGIGLAGAAVLAAVVILGARWFTGLDAVSSWMVRYDGEYDLPDFVDDGFPAWARWSHFLNFFFMAMIIQSGLRVRQQQKPPAVWQPKKGGKKISIHLWLHTSLDVLWMVNGLAFIVMLFVSGHWARIVPTSWEVFPNALSSMLQYASMQWPAENGWVNYNSLQQIMYFLVVFIAAPLAIISGLRMSEWWPKNATKLNKIYPAPVARKIHFPTMLFFVLFIVAHVFLVFATGMTKNLNHMFAGTPVDGWGGFFWMLGGVLLTIGILFATRPLVLAPVASRFGQVSAR